MEYQTLDNGKDVKNEIFHNKMNYFKQKVCYATSPRQ